MEGGREMRIKNRETGLIIDVIGVWGTKKRTLYHHLAGPHTAIGYDDDEPFTPTGKYVGRNGEYERIFLKDSWERI
jgi:hypothetical protein